jgi:hypothetical protein
MVVLDEQGCVASCAHTGRAGRRAEGLMHLSPTVAARALPPLPPPPPPLSPQPYSLQVPCMEACLAVCSTFAMAPSSALRVNWRPQCRWPGGGATSCRRRAGSGAGGAKHTHALFRLLQHCCCSLPPEIHSLPGAGCPVASSPAVQSNDNRRRRRSAQRATLAAPGGLEPAHRPFRSHTCSIHLADCRPWHPVGQASS